MIHTEESPAISRTMASRLVRGELACCGLSGLVVDSAYLLWTQWAFCGLSGLVVASGLAPRWSAKRSHPSHPHSHWKTEPVGFRAATQPNAGQARSPQTSLLTTYKPAAALTPTGKPRQQVLGLLRSPTRGKPAHHKQACSPHSNLLACSPASLRFSQPQSHH